MAKETKLKKNIMKKIKNFTPPKYFIDDVVLINRGEIMTQCKIIGAEYKRNTWDYYVEFSRWYMGDVKVDRYIWEGKDILTKINK